MVNLTLRFVACYLHFFAVHDDDEVACVDVRGELGLMLATEAKRYLSRHST